jgi:hypothetical protein
MNGNSEPKLGGYEYVLFLGIVIRHRAAWGNHAHARKRAARLRTPQVSNGRRPIEIRHAND